ncbi:hypothetical protein, partial [Pseudomonas sp. FEN]|uniref:hypothetical protein n=1 Tax=Pseudomonas sp. FEN TaxID=2767468 RepID=UPI001CD819C5
MTGRNAIVVRRNVSIIFIDFIYICVVTIRAAVTFSQQIHTDGIAEASYWENPQKRLVAIKNLMPSSNRIM